MKKMKIFTKNDKIVF